MKKETWKIILASTLFATAATFVIMYSIKDWKEKKSPGSAAASTTVSDQEKAQTA